MQKEREMGDHILLHLVGHTGARNVMQALVYVPKVAIRRAPWK